MCHNGLVMYFPIEFIRTITYGLSYNGYNAPVYALTNNGNLNKSTNFNMILYCRLYKIYKNIHR